MSFENNSQNYLMNLLDNEGTHPDAFADFMRDQANHLRTINKADISDDSAWSSSSSSFNTPETESEPEP